MTTYQTEQDINAKKQVLKQYTNYSEDKIKELAKTLTTAQIAALILKTSTFYAHGLMSYTPMTFNFPPSSKDTDSHIIDFRSMYPNTSLIQQKNPHKEIVRPEK